MSSPRISPGYSLSEAARLLRISAKQLREWVGRCPGSKLDSILKSDIGWFNGSLLLSFANLIELRTMEYFMAFNVRGTTIREIVREFEEELNHPHPFATQIIFRVGGRNCLEKIAKAKGNRRLSKLKAGNWSILEIIEKSLLREVNYDAKGDAVEWTPRIELPSIIVRPGVAFGRPVLKKEKLSTRALYDAFLAGGHDAPYVARKFNVDPAGVLEAVAFELNVAMHLTRIAATVARDTLPIGSNVINNRAVGTLV